MRFTRGVKPWTSRIERHSDPAGNLSPLKNAEIMRNLENKDSHTYHRHKLAFAKSKIWTLAYVTSVTGLQ